MALTYYLWVALLFGLVQAQFQPTLQTVEDIADGNVAEARDFLNASKQAPAASSFSQRRDLAPVGSFARPLLQRGTGAGTEFGSVGEFERKTQAPLVWLRLHSSKILTPSSTSSFVALAEPVFPGGSASVASKIAATVREAAATVASTAGGNLQKVIAAGKAQLVEDAVRSIRDEQISGDAYLLAHANLMRELNTGGCPRDYSSCPSGWAMEGQLCVPSVEYSGFCGATDLASANTAQKEQFAQTCEAPFPCQDTCKPNFSACPTGWSTADETCNAPAGYQGICSTATSMAGMSNSAKSAWAAMCGAKFPCA